MMMHFGVYLAHEKLTKIYLYLKADAAKQAAATTWDAENHEAISKDNNLLECLMNKTDNID